MPFWTRAVSAAFAAIAALALLTITLPPAAASTRAWSTSDLTLRQGPGPAYQVTGAIPTDSRIQVHRCSALWCLVEANGAKGWTGLSHITFGQGPKGPFEGPKLNYASGGPGQVCLFEGTNYTGASICGVSGQVFPDLLLYGRDNRYSSISVTGNVSAAACRDRNLKSYCERITESQPVLDSFLNNNLSSLRVY